jgi:hypothetical protein
VVKIRNALHILFTRFKGKSSLGRPQHRKENNNKMDHKETDVRAWSG